MRKARCFPNRERIESDDLLRKLMELLFVYRGMIRVTILKNIALVTYALIILFHGARGGNGWLSKAALARFKIKPGHRIPFAISDSEIITLIPELFNLVSNVPSNAKASKRSFPKKIDNFPQRE